MFVVVWIFIGLIAGYFGSKLIADSRDDGLAPFLGAGAIGAVLGGGALALLGVGNFSEANLWSTLGAALGGLCALAAYSLIWRQP